MLDNRELSDRLQDAVVTIGPMTRDELAETIIQPAEKTGLTFEPGLPETILDDVGDEPGGLPLLEFLLEALWRSGAAASSPTMPTSGWGAYRVPSPIAPTRCSSAA